MKNHIKNILYQISGNKNETYIDLYIDFCLHNHSPELIGGQNHHIVSKTLFPEFQDFKLNQWNLSRLSNHNHYIAHAILYYAIDNFTHGSAWYAMNNKNFITEKHRPIELIGPELYDKLISKRNKMVSDKYKNEVMAKRVDTGEILKVTREEFNNNENLVGSTKGKGGEHLKRTISVLDEDGNSKRISIDSEEYKCGNYIGHTVGKTVYKDKHGNTCMCSVDDPRVLSGELVGINKGRKQSKESIEKYKLARVGLRPSAIKSIIFNEKDEPEFYSDGNFKEICARYDLPENLLYKTMKNNDTLDIISYFNNSKSNIKARIHKYLIYQGWYVRKVKYIKI